MRVGILTREWPPDIYGGAGVHVTHLARELAQLASVDVHCFGTQRAGATAHGGWEALADANPALRVLGTDLAMTAGVAGCDVVHSHTWYTNLAGHLAKLLYGVPHVATSHSLEPLRPWKAEQLGGGYALSCWAERTALEAADAVIAVSVGMCADVLTTYPAVDPGRVHVIPNGVDTAEFCPDPHTDALERHGIRSPYVLHVGRITRQKGLPHLLAAARMVDPTAQIVLCASSPDTAAFGSEVAAGIRALQEERGGIVWLRDPVPHPELVQLYTHASMFVCPSVYEPQGIVNLEAMACETAVVASAVGGIPEVVDDGSTGLLVRYDAGDTTRFDAGLAQSMNTLLADPARAKAMGRAGRVRAVEQFGWARIAMRTVDLYRDLLG